MFLSFVGNSSFIPQSVLRQVHSLFPNRVLHRARYIASSFNLQYLLVSWRSSSSYSRLLLLRLSTTSILASIFTSITRFKRQFLRKMWPFQLSFLLFIVCRIFLSSLTLRNTSSFLTRSVQLICYIHRVEYWILLFSLLYGHLNWNHVHIVHNIKHWLVEPKVKRVCFI